MKKFEYKRYSCENLNSISDVHLNKYGKEGWELVGYSSDATIYNGKVFTYHHFILKREIK